MLLLWLVGKGVAARGGNLKKNKLEGGLGGGRSASPPDALDVLAFVGVSLQEEPGCIGSGVTRCLSVLMCVFLVFMLVLEGVWL